ncbi:MAG: 2-isopropylmalate synthase [Dehalococcoidia bacterium]|jgi:isopropylmalate/homocitrate/citramalate synthase|nr:MAG: 2-isopropylmalate synthase [Dehalococcoidia bacterium]
MTKDAINPERKYFNFRGGLPSWQMAAAPASIPAPGPATHPKLITDTTLRDGAQDPCFAIFPNETKLKYFDLLHELDNGTGTIESIEVFIYQKRDLWTLEKLLERGYDYPRVTTWTRATPKDIRELVKVSAGRIKETGMLASSSDHHIFDRLGFRSKEEAAERYLAPILTACENDITPRIHLEDATRADVEGFVIPFIHRVMAETGGRCHFRICDTLGAGIPDPMADLPFGIPRLVSRLYESTGTELEFHGHDDFGNATANSMAALRYGCKRANVTFAGFGERTGNAALEQVLANYIREYGNPGLKIEVLADITRLIGLEVAPVPEQQPIIGGRIYTTQAGLHQTGVQRQTEAPGGLIYLPFDPTMLGRHNEIMHRIGSLSGIDGIISVLNRYRASGEGDHVFSQTSRLVKYVYDRVHEAYDGCYDTEQGCYLGYRTTFFEPEELARLVVEYELQHRRSSAD